MKDNRIYKILSDYVHHTLDHGITKYHDLDSKAFRFINKLVESGKIDFDDESDLCIGMVEIMEMTILVLADCKYLSVNFEILDFIAEQEKKHI